MRDGQIGVRSGFGFVVVVVAASLLVMMLSASALVALPSSSFFAVGGDSPATKPFSTDEFVADQTPRTLQEREDAILALFRSGCYPDFLNEWRTVTVSRQDTNGQTRTVEFEVMPDYLAVGDNSDWMRMPMQPWTAQQLCNETDWSLPTRFMVNAIWSASERKLAPQPLNEPRTTPVRFLFHHDLIEAQLAGRGIEHEADGEMAEKIAESAKEPPSILNWRDLSDDEKKQVMKEMSEEREDGEIVFAPRSSRIIGGSGRPFVAGIKKDVIITDFMVGKPNNVAIYGWHYQSGTPIQPIYTGHVYFYVDYSHGIRPVKRTVRVDGVERDLHDILSDPVLHPLLSDEGQMQFLEYSDPN